MRIGWEDAIERLERAYADATVRAYRSDYADFARWCALRSKRPFPASESLVSRYLRKQPRELNPTTLKRRLVAISRLHLLTGHPDPTETVDTALELLRRFRRHAKFPQQAFGLTRDRLQLLLATCDSSKKGLRDRALLLTGFEALCRRSELVKIACDDIAVGNRERLRITVHQTKSGPLVRDRFVTLSGFGTEAVSEWIAVADINSGPVFRPVYRERVVGRFLTPHTVSRVLKARARLAGLSEADVGSISGHSLRVGAAQQLALDGHDIAQIMRAGGWRSIGTLQRYVEGAPVDLWD